MHSALNREIILPVLLVIMLAGVLEAQPAPDLTGSYFHFSLAKMHHLREDYGAAVAEFEKALASDPESSSIRTEMARALVQLDEIQRAVELCQQAVEIAPSETEPRLVLGQIFYSNRRQEGMREKALEQFNSVLEIDPGQEEALQRAAELYYEQREYGKASELFAQLRRQDPSMIRTYYFEAQALVERGEVDRAIEILEQGLDVRDDIPDYLTLLAGLHRRVGNLEQAEQVYRRGLAHGPDPRLHEGLAGVLVDLGEGEEAVPLLEKLLNVYPDRTDLQRDLAKAYRLTNRLEESAEILKRVLNEDPHDIQANYEYANVLLLLDEWVEAEEVLSFLLESENPLARQHRNVFRTNLGLLYEESGRWDEAVRLFEEVVEESPEDKESRLRLLYAYRESGRSEKALTLSESLVEEYGEDPGVLMARSQVLSTVDRVEEGVDLLLNSAQSSSEPGLLYVAASQLYFSEEQFDLALDVLREGLTVYPDNPRIRFQMGATYERKQDYDSAEAEFQKILSQDPDRADVLNYLGYMLAERGVRLSEALGYAQRAVDLDPYNGAYLDSLGWVYYKKDRLDEAEKFLLKAYQLEKTDPVILEHLGDLFFKKGDVEEARRYYQKSLEHGEKEEEKLRVRKKLEELSAVASGRR